MIHHFTLTVRNLKKSRAFYEKVLAPLGYGVTKSFEGFIGFGDGKKPSMWLKQGKKMAPMHLAFTAGSREAVDAFHATALELGAEDHGAPGPRPHYHPDYYGAFVIDPDGHPIEAVYVGKATAARKKR